MSMGNYKSPQRVGSDTMAVSHTPIGLDHLTTVPENFDPTAQSADEEVDTWESDDRSDASSTLERDLKRGEAPRSTGSK